jgi:hypothetical protein
VNITIAIVDLLFLNILLTIGGVRARLLRLALREGITVEAAPHAREMRAADFMAVVVFFIDQVWVFMGLVC